MTDELIDTNPEEIDLENPLVQSTMFTDLFHDLESCDSKRVDDFWDLLDETVLEVLNIRKNGTDK
jgi:hypothetical protein